MKNITKGLFLLITIVLLAGLLAACSQNETKTETLPVVRYVNIKVYDPVYVGIDKGFYTARGIDVQIVGDTLAGPTGLQAVSAGQADAGLSSIPAIVNARGAGLGVIGVTDVQSALPDQPLEVYFVRSDSGIETIKDIEGKTFAVNLWNSSFHYTALMALEQAGVDTSKVNFVLLPFADQPQALANGEVDVIGLMQPYVNFAQETYGDQFKEIFNAIDIFGTKQFSLHFLNTTWAKYNPDQATAFVQGTIEAEQWIEDNQDEAREIIAKYTKVEAKYVPDYHFQEGGAVIMDDVQFWIDYMLARGDLKADWLKVSDVATNEYSH